MRYLDINKKVKFLREVFLFGLIFINMIGSKMADGNLKARPIEPNRRMCKYVFLKEFKDMNIENYKTSFNHSTQ